MGVVYIDTETTGLDPERHEIWEIALITEDGDERVWQLPVDMARADLISLNIGHFYERRLPDGKLTFHGAAVKHLELLTRGQHLVGAIPSFDEERLRKLFLAHHRLPTWHYHIIDIEALMVGWIARAQQMARLGYIEPEVQVRLAKEKMLDTIPLPYVSKALSRAIGVNPNDFEAHTALGDARWAKAVYEKVMGKC